MHIIDAHNHSLAEIDDGAKNLEMSLAMLKVAEQNGTKEIILTPHHLNGAYMNFADQIEHQMSILRNEAAINNINIKLHAGCEVHLVPESIEHLVEKKALTYCGLGKAALVELPKHSIPTGIESIFSDLIYNGITPIIAHPERNSSLRRDFGPLKEWVEFGCKSQVTGQSCTGGFGKDLQKIAFDMISNNLVHLIASDAHRPSGRSPKLLHAASIIKKLYGEHICQILFSSNPAKLTTGDELLNLSIPPKKFKTKTKRNRSSKNKSFLQKIIRLVS